LSGFADDTDAPSPLPIHAETSLRRTARPDPAMNLLRNGASAFAAAVGGADSLTVRPHEDSPRAARLARNVSRLLHHEARLGAIADPGAGSGAIEALTLDLARAAWRLFQEIEAGGGLEALVRSGAWQERIRQSAADAEAAVRRGDIALVGAHRFLAGNEADPPPPATGNRRLGDIVPDPSA
jgi:methylmalonyl-CoA mutase